MTEPADRHDRMAAGYEQWWAPVLAPSAIRLLDRIDPIMANGGRSDRQVLDVGIGTGNLAIPAVCRWPSARVVGIDASPDMIRAAEALADERLDESERRRLTTRVAVAAQLPFEDASFDIAMSSFVLQLVPSRATVLREIRRVLRPGGRLAYVTWLADRSSFEPDRVFDRLLDEFGFEEDTRDERCGDVPSAGRGANELRRAGFRDASASAEMLEYAFTVEAYLAFLTEFDERTLFAEMERTERRRFLARLRQALMALDPSALVFRAPIVYAQGRRADD
ncbi:MAG: class I SAM-dependent methyltransferase [Candidatus Limnocylindrales bacterium]